MNPIQDLRPEDSAALRALEAVAETIYPRPEFEVRLESELKSAHGPRIRILARGRDMLQFAGWAAAVVVLALFLSWLFRSLRPVRVPAQDGTATPVPQLSTTTPYGTPGPQPTPGGEGYEWRGTTLYLSAEMPTGPGEAAVFQAQPEIPATLQFAQQLAEQFGVQGGVYELPGELPGTRGFLVFDGKQSLEVRSDLYFTYYPDINTWRFDNATLQVPDVERQIDDFMRAHGFDFPYRVEASEFYTGYYALPLAEDGLDFHHDYFKSGGMLFSFDRDGIGVVRAGLVKHEQVGVYAVRTAQEAFERLLDPNTMAGVLEGVHSSTQASPSWHRIYPHEQTITLYDWVNVYKPLTLQGPLVILDGRRVTGALGGLDDFTESKFIEAVGRLHSENGVEVFEIESWQLYQGNEDGVQGTLQQGSGQVVLVTPEGETLIMPDVPADVTLPMENVYAIGVKKGDVFEWKSFDLRMVGGGGGGGGGGVGLYTLNLSGPPIPIPSPTPIPQATAPAAGESFQYTIVAGDTLSSIAAAFGTTAESLMEYNGLTDPATIFVGQIIAIPGPSLTRAEAWRGLLNITILKLSDGTQRTQYGFMQDGGAGFYILQGDLSALDAYQNRPVTVWGEVSGQDSNGQPFLTVKKYEIPYPDLTFTILHGAQANQTIDGQLLTFFTTQDGQRYVVLYPDGLANENPLDPGSEDVLAEVLLLPGETYAGYPAIRIFGSAMAINPKTGAPSELTITADQPYVMEDPTAALQNRPTATVEKIELVYFLPDPRYQKTNASGGPAYIQPMWRFSGHYSTGDEFEILVQALKDEYLSPEIQPIEGPG